MQPMNRYGFKAKTIAEMGLGQWDRVEYFGAHEMLAGQGLSNMGGCGRIVTHMNTKLIHQSGKFVTNGTALR